MHRSFLPYLADPRTGEPLTLEVAETRGESVLSGMLHSSTGEYPVIRGVPRFVALGDREYVKSFGFQWNRWKRTQFESENVGKPMQGHTAGMWQRITEAGDVRGQVLLDYGCGPGRFIEVARGRGAKVIGIDISDAVEAASGNFRDDADVLICQADALAPPIRRASVDGAFSIGVLHHTPDPRRAFNCMVGAVKNGGWAALAVYGKGGYYDFPTVALYRGIFKALWPVFGPYPALFYSFAATYGLAPLSKAPVIGPPLRLFFPFVRLPDRAWSFLDTFDSVTPSYQSAHDSHEVYRWFKDAGMTAVAPSDWGFASYHGAKP